MTVVVALADGTHEAFETVEELESGWLRCRRPRDEPRPDLPGETTTKYYPLESVETVSRERN
ncbi:hypothetical protein [Natronococcus jeotgali]|uniref:Uncharacterized protein n=1 Tax=Natronococcus jeotgali DSM 18795 TaxID=1227498 RepID=L9X2P7_9EURY|nr:hypothetical protein [Natronococcus jeotgali]ELY55751.1 hypothetical protein C492_15791 [Natronococcus jeotgali DSM 18795]